MESKASDKHKFQEDSGMTFEEVFNFAYKSYISSMQNLAKELGEDGFLEALERACSQTAVQGAQNAAKSTPGHDLATYTEPLRNPSRFLQHSTTFDIVEDTETAFEIVVSECLSAKTFREGNAADIGYTTCCHPDLAACQAFNPKIKLILTKTLMQGDDCCNCRWVWEE